MQIWENKLLHLVPKDLFTCVDFMPSQSRLWTCYVNDIGKSVKAANDDILYDFY